MTIGNTLLCWPEHELHGTTAISKEGVTLNLSQNLVKRTVSAIKKWRDGSEATRHFNYRLNQLNQNLLAREALLNSIEKNQGKKNNEIILEGSNEYEGDHVNLDIVDREWAE